MSVSLLLVAALVSQSPNYVRLRADSDDPDPHCLWWRSPALTLHFQEEGAQDFPVADTFAAARRSVATWQAAMESCSALRLTEGPPVSSRDVEYVGSAPETTQNVLVFRSRGECRNVVPQNDPCRKVSLFHCANVHDCWPHASGALAVTSSFHDPRTGEILDADIEFNDARFRFTATEAEGPVCAPPNYEGCVHYDFENTLTHELGHFVGLDHASALTSTMHPEAGVGETNKRSLDPDSVQFLCDVYPPSQYPRDCVLDRLDPELGRASCSGAATGPALFALVGWLLAWPRAGRRGRRP